MAKTSAERQAAYRARRDDGEGERRLDTRVTTAAHFALDRLAACYRVTRREMIERLILEADAAILKTLYNCDSVEWGDYFNLPQKKGRRENLP